MSSYKGQVIDFFDRRTAYDAEGDSHPREAKLLLESVLIRSGFKDILIESDRSGKYINSNYVAAWDGQDFYPRGNPLLKAVSKN